MYGMRPVVGITSYVEQARWGVWDVPAAVLPFRYVERVEAAGATAVLLPPSAASDTAVLDRLDGVVFAGGADLDPALYEQEPHAETKGLRPERDAAEVPLMRAALERDLPVLGVCRGMQIMAVVSGGSLVQHLPDTVGHEGHRPAPGVYGLHDVRLEPGSLVHKLLGSSSVPSYHHQGLASPGSLTVTGWADDDSPEVVEDPAHRFALGVLWHPEAATTSGCSRAWSRRATAMAAQDRNSAPHRARRWPCEQVRTPAVAVRDALVGCFVGPRCDLAALALSVGVHPGGLRVEQRLLDHDALNPVAEHVDGHLGPRRRDLDRQVPVRDRGAHRVTEPSGRHPSHHLVAHPHRLAAERDGARVGEREAAEPSRQSLLLAARNVSRPSKPPGLSSFTQNPSPASYGSVSGVMSVLQTR